MKISIVINSFLNNDKIFIPLSYIFQLFSQGINEINLILINNSVKIAKKGYSKEIKIKKEIKQAIKFQAGIDIDKLKNLYDIFIFLKENYNFKLKVCNTSAILLGYSKKIGDYSNLEEIFEIATLFEIVNLILNSNLTIYF